MTEEKYVWDIEVISPQIHRVHFTKKVSAEEAINMYENYSPFIEDITDEWNLDQSSDGISFTCVKVIK